MSHSRWNLLPPPDRQAETWSGVPSLLKRLLNNRGITDYSKAISFLTAGEDLACDPNSLPDMPLAIARLYRAMLSNEIIAIYGDYDADGVTATTLLVQGLSMLGCKAIPYIPHRLNEGYGLNIPALEWLKKQNVSLVVTVDCGITAIAEVKKAKQLGLDVIITDHHEPGNELPEALAVVNPKRNDSKYPFRELAGVGVAYKLLQALFNGLGKAQQLEGLTDIVAIGTIADIVPLLGENRYITRKGLASLNASPRLGIRELLSQAGAGNKGLGADTISFVIAPRLNAAGRLEHAMSSYELLTTDSPEEAKRLAEWLEQKNSERQKLTADVFGKAQEQAQEQPNAPVIVVRGADFPAGIVGLVAGKLTDEYYRPSIVIHTGHETSGGSCRSIPELDIMKALIECERFLTRFGGHSRAAGFSLLTADIPAFRDAICAVAADQLAGVDLRPSINIDAEVKLSSLNRETYASIQELAPFGEGNPVPIFLTRRVDMLECRIMGSTGDHLRLKLKHGDSLWDGVAFGLGNHKSVIAPLIDIVYSLEMDRWNGQERLRINIIDFAPAT